MCVCEPSEKHRNASNTGATDYYHHNYRVDHYHHQNDHTHECAILQYGADRPSD